MHRLKAPSQQTWFRPPQATQTPLPLQAKPVSQAAPPASTEQHDWPCAPQATPTQVYVVRLPALSVQLFWGPGQERTPFVTQQAPPGTPHWMQFPVVVSHTRPDPQVAPAQQLCPSAPHAVWHVDVNVPWTHVPAVHVSPEQQGSPPAPQATHWPVLHFEPVLQLPLQHALPAVPQPVHDPLVQVPFVPPQGAPSPRQVPPTQQPDEHESPLQHGFPGVPQLKQLPPEQMSPLPQVSLRQHGWPEAPQVTAVDPPVPVPPPVPAPLSEPPALPPVELPSIPASGRDPPAAMVEPPEPGVPPAAAPPVPAPPPPVEASDALLRLDLSLLLQARSPRARPVRRTPLCRIERLRVPD